MKLVNEQLFVIKGQETNKAENLDKSRLSALFVASPPGFEPGAFRLGGGPSILLRYGDIYEILWLSEPDNIRFSLKSERCNIFLGGERSILLSYGDFYSSEKDFTKKLGDCQRKVKLFIKTAMSTCAGTAVAVFAKEFYSNIMT